MADTGDPLSDFCYLSWLKGKNIPPRHASLLNRPGGRL